MQFYNFKILEKKWQSYWRQNKIFKSYINKSKKKFYILDMFPYPSGSGLHVGHTIGYIASDIFSRYKMNKGYNVLHPMGFDSFGLPAEQYAIQTGQHPIITTQKNSSKYKEQLYSLGISFDWDRELSTSKKNYYKWTQWIFIKLFESWYDFDLNLARPISLLISNFEKNGNFFVNTISNKTIKFSSNQWIRMKEKKKQLILLNYRLAFLSYINVNWCPKLNTVLANEEVKNGISERGGYRVFLKKMKQWSLRTTSYQERLLNDLDQLKWQNNIKTIQNNWIGKYEDFGFIFNLFKNKRIKINIFIKFIRDIYYINYIAISLENILIKIVLNNLNIIKNYKNNFLLLQNNGKNFIGIFTGKYALNPLNSNKIPIWINNYLLKDLKFITIGNSLNNKHDHFFAKKFNISVNNLIEINNKNSFIFNNNNIIINSLILNKLKIKKIYVDFFKRIEKRNFFFKKKNYKIHDSIFSRQRYWGEPLPIFYKKKIPYSISEKNLPIILPKLKEYKFNKNFSSPFENFLNWRTKNGYYMDTNTMPAWAGSNWYFLRYMNSDNKKHFVGKNEKKYWKCVDLYIGGAEHATGHLIYSRFIVKFLYDLNYLNIQEPFTELLNQGIIQIKSYLVYRIENTNKFISFNLKNKYNTVSIHIDINFVNNNILDINKFKLWRNDFNDAEFILENNKYICGDVVEKMSKSKHNVINPDDFIKKYGADTYRIYMMFLGPIDQSKYWNINGINGIFRFINKLWNLFYNEKGDWVVVDKKPTDKELKIINKTIKKVEKDIINKHFNTAISALMICVNELYIIKCNTKLILSNLIILLSPFAPHLSEEKWKILGNKNSVIKSIFPIHKDECFLESSFKYSIFINGKLCEKIIFSSSISSDEIKKKVLSLKNINKFLKNKNIKNFIIVHNKIINIIL